MARASARSTTATSALATRGTSRAAWSILCRRDGSTRTGSAAWGGRRADTSRRSSRPPAAASPRSASAPASPTGCPLRSSRPLGLRQSGSLTPTLLCAQETYYYNTDITQFCPNYLGATPADDKQIYELTSPMTRIHEACTPTLIQHVKQRCVLGLSLSVSPILNASPLQGELDRRVPIANGYELWQGLLDVGVHAEMAVYTGYGHGIDKPRSQRAVMAHNRLWFGHYIFGEPAPSLSLLGDASNSAQARL